MLAHYGQTGMTWSQGEFTGDGTVDINDLTIVLANYGQTAGAAGRPATVPEPAAAVLLAAAAVVLLAGLRLDPRVRKAGDLPPAPYDVGIVRGLRPLCVRGKRRTHK